MAPFLLFMISNLFTSCREKAVSKVKSSAGALITPSEDRFLSAFVDLRVKHIPQPVAEQVDHQHQHY